MNTKSTNEIWVNENFFEDLARSHCKNQITEAEKKLNEYVLVLSKELASVTSAWIKIEGRDIYYVHKHRILIPDINSFRCSIVNESGFTA